VQVKSRSTTALAIKRALFSDGDNHTQPVLGALPLCSSSCFTALLGACASRVLARNSDVLDMDRTRAFVVFVIYREFLEPFQSTQTNP